MSDNNLEKELEIVRQFTLTNPTFSFDGMEETLKIKLRDILKRIPPIYVFEVQFSSRHGGYGNRVGKFLPQVITSHVMIVRVYEGKVKSAIIDKKWDEINQKLL